MDSLSVITLIIVVVGGLSLVYYNWSVKRFKPILARLAASKKGLVRSPPLLMPKLTYSHMEWGVEFSCASTGIDGRSQLYTYVLFDQVQLPGFDFRIKPRSIETSISRKLGANGLVELELGELDRLVSICTSDRDLLKRVFNPTITKDLLFWAGHEKHSIHSVRNYDDKLIYSVFGMIDNDHDAKILIDSATNLVVRLSEIQLRE